MFDDECWYGPSLLENSLGRSECKGVFLRCRVNSYVSNGEVVFQTRFRRIKSRSCPDDCVGPTHREGCQAEWFFESLNEHGTDILVLPSKDDIKHGALYKVRLDSMGEEYEWGLEEVKEEVPGEVNK